jgi:pantothenate kinase
MGRTSVSPDGHEIAELVEALPTGRFVRCRFLLGLSGAPGSGKTRLATALAEAYGVPVVAMDGFHRPSAELVAMGRLEAKGAPDTFDAEAYAALLRRLQAGGDVRAPAFDHRLPDPLPDAITVPAESGLVVTEGNYLLLDQPRWHAVRQECDAVWHLVTDEATRIQRLVKRHNDSGKDPAHAREWVARVDQPNADLVEAAAAVPDAADEVLDLTDWSGRIERPVPERRA